MKIKEECSEIACEGDISFLKELLIRIGNPMDADYLQTQSTREIFLLIKSCAHWRIINVACESAQKK